MGRLRKPLALNPLTLGQEAWIAGIIEGEGSMGARTAGGYTWPMIVVEMADLDVIEKLESITGVGNIIPVKKKENRKQLYRWTVAAHNDAIALAKAIYPWMGARRKAQLDTILELE